MENAPEKSSNESKKSFLASLMWWKVNLTEIAKEVEQRNSLKLSATRRGISGFLLCFSAAISLCFIIFSDRSSDFSSKSDIVFLCLLIPFVFMGHRWALITAMVYWTSSKIYGVTVKPATLFMQVIWWSVYMRYFWEALLIQNRIKALERPVPPPALKQNVVHLPSVVDANELEKLFELKNRGAISEDEFTNAKKKMGL